MLSDEEKQTIDYLKARLYGNEGCKFIDVAQSDLRIFLKLVENLQKDIESWKKYCNEQENDITLKNNKICDLEFKIEKQSKEIEELKENNKLLQENYSSAHEDINWFCENYISKEVSEQKERKAYIKGTNDADELCNKKWEDKIKAKIEEIENTGIDIAWEQVNYTIREQDRAKIQVLQSLLEKE